jgi:mono/diheme cytochrome c family protein
LLILLGILFFSVCSTRANDKPALNQAQLPATYVPSGQRMYKEYCSACHGADAKGNGPTASTLKTAPPDLTTLAKRHMGKFPYDYVSSVLRFAPGSSAHGSKDMPTWGRIFYVIDKNNEEAVQRRIYNLCDYLASLQQK